MAPSPLPIPETEEAPEQVPLPSAYAICASIVRRHRENFPVAARFLDPDRRRALEAIYAFARTADDLADAEAPTADRLAALDRIEASFLRALDGEPQGPILTALADSIDRHRLSVEPFLDLLEAFRKDARNETFPTWDDLLAYCRGSANPVGRLVLALHDVEDPAAARESDSICTALQLTNMWQDLGRDLDRGRLFIPLEDLERFDLTPSDLTRPAKRAALSRLLTHECHATDELFARGERIARRVPLPLRIQLRATIAGGRAVLAAVKVRGWTVVRHRPSLSRYTRARILARALLGLDG